MGHEKAARLPFCTCPCDILSGVSMYVILRRACSCVLMQQATTFSIFYDGLSFQHLAAVLISVLTLCYGPGIPFRGPLYICVFRFRVIPIYYKYDRNEKPVHGKAKK
jgi:hypothetical protein